MNQSEVDNDGGYDDDDLFCVHNHHYHPMETTRSNDDSNTRHCVSPVLMKESPVIFHQPDPNNTNDHEMPYSTPMSSPVHTMSGCNGDKNDDNDHKHDNNDSTSCTNTSTAVVSWPLPNYTWTTWNGSSSNDNSNNIDNMNNIMTSDVPYKGITNLGNTCYMASALQMLGSIPSLTDRLVAQNEISPLMDTTKLRVAFRSVMEQLNERHTSSQNDNRMDHQHMNHDDDTDPISPQTLKDAMDERTTLFVGYRQHDAHEFITTLLDVLDADYKHPATNTIIITQPPPTPSPSLNITAATTKHDVTPLGESTTVTTNEQSFDEIMDDAVVVNINNKEVDDDDDDDHAKFSDQKITNAMDDDNDCGGAELILGPPPSNGDDNDNTSNENHPMVVNNRSKKQKMDESITKPTSEIDDDDETMSGSMPSLLYVPRDTVATPSPPPHSYSALDVNAIERLIHGESSPHNPIVTTDTHHHFESYQPQHDRMTDGGCKLVGGRMSTNDVLLTPYSSSDEQNESTSSLRFPSLLTMMPQPPQPHPAIATTTTHRDAVGGTHSDPMMESETEHENAVVLSPIDTTFTTEVRVRLTCDSCKFTRTHKETYLHLSLEIGSSSSSNESDDLCSMSGNSSIEDGLRRFFAPCTQELKCEKCFCETATQCIEITKLPPVLLLHLKRFIVDYSPDWSSISYRKNQSAVYLNEDLSLNHDSGALSEFLASDCAFIISPPSVAAGSNTSLSSLSSLCRSSSSKYVLRSVVNHIGSSANCGHYTADAQRGEQNEWFRFNDTSVSSLSATDVIEESKQTAYMCLYELV